MNRLCAGRLAKNGADGMLHRLLLLPAVMMTLLLIGGVLAPPAASAGELSDDLKIKISQTLEEMGVDDVKIDLNVRIPMTIDENPLGYDCDLWATVMYHTSVYEDTGSAKRPTILLATAYRREIMGMMRLLFSFLPNDYNVIMVDMRGTGSGSGFWDALGPIEQYDVKHVVDDWIPAQPWSDGTVGMVGGSYEGILQYLVAGLVEQEYCPEKGAMVPKHLKAIAPLSAFNDTYSDIAVQGGNFDEEFMAVWIAVTDFLSVLPPDLILGYHSQYGINQADIEEALQILQEHANQLRMPIDWIMDPENELKNEWYELKSPMLYWPQKPAGGWQFSEGIPPEVGGNTISNNLPVFTATGWFDIFTRGSLNNFQYGLANHSPSDKAMIIGPWYHIDAAFTFPGINGMGLIGQDFLFTWDVMVRWFDWKLKGKNDPFMEEFPVAMYVLGEEKWRAEKTWPLPESRVEDKTYYFSKKKSSWIFGDWFSVGNAENNYKLVSNTSDSDFNTWFLGMKYPKANPVLEHDPSKLHGMTSRSAQRWFGFSPLTVITQLFKYDLNINDSDDLVAWEDERPDEDGVLTFSTETLSEDIEISGPLKLTFWAETEFYTHPMSDADMDKTIATIREQFDIEGDENLLVNFAEKEDVQWVVEINDVFPNGRARNITSGWLSAAHRPYDPANPTDVDPEYTAFDPFYNYADKNPHPIVENTTYKYVMEIWPTTNVFKKGHRIRVSISASDFPHLFPVLTSSTNTIVLDESHKAKLDFKVVNKNDEGITWKWIDQNIADYLLTENN